MCTVAHHYLLLKINLLHVQEWDLSYKSWSVLLQNLVTISAFSAHPAHICGATTSVMKNLQDKWLLPDSDGWCCMVGRQCWWSWGLTVHGSGHGQWSCGGCVSRVQCSLSVQKDFWGKKDADGHCPRSSPGNIKVKLSACVLLPLPAVYWWGDIVNAFMEGAILKQYKSIFQWLFSVVSHPTLCLKWCVYSYSEMLVSCNSSDRIVHLSSQQQ